MEKISFFFRLFLYYCICLLNIACQHNSNFTENTACNNIVHDDSIIKSVFDVEKEKMVPCHLNADIALNDSILRLHPEYPLYNTICDCLGLNNPVITILGYKDVRGLRLLKLHAADILHNHLYVLLFDNNGHFVDSTCSPEPISGDQLGHDDGVPVEWHYYSNFYFKNELEKITTSCDLKRYDERIDTLYYAVCQTKYKVDMDKNKFVEYTKDSIVKGTPF